MRAIRLCHPIPIPKILIVFQNLVLSYLPVGIGYLERTFQAPLQPFVHADLPRAETFQHYLVLAQERCHTSSIVSNPGSPAPGLRRAESRPHRARSN